MPRSAPPSNAACPCLRRADALRALAATHRTVAVSGSHGKTTSSSMLALILRAAGWRPSFIIGGDLNEVGTNAAYDEGEWLVVEADESDGTFLELAPEAAIVTNIEPDHLDHYGGFAGLTAAFDQFFAGIPGVRIACADDPIARRLAAAHPGAVTYGFAEDATYRIVSYEGDRRGSRFAVHQNGRELGSIDLPVPGRHNAANATGATALALELGAPFEAAVDAMRGFGGVARRFQFRGEIDGVTLVDDYAHIPGEIAAMIDAAREGGWGRVIVVFQPHRYTRTARLWRDFADAFTGADQVVLTDVYAANETPQPGVSGRLILGAVLDANPALPVVYLPRRVDVVQHALRLARPGDVVLTLGAGDLTTVPDEWLMRGRVVNASVDLASLAGDLRERLPDATSEGASFAELSTYRVGGPVAVLVRAGHVDALTTVAEVARRHRPRLLVIGRGSNLLMSDAGFSGLVVVLEGDFEAIDVPANGAGESESPAVRAGGAVPLPVLARRAAAGGLAGLEFYVGIPGSVGGAVRMNAGGHGRETAEVLRRAWVLDLLDGDGNPASSARDVVDLELDYRHSNLRPSEVVTAAEFTVTRDDPAACEARVAEIVRWRREHQPGGQNAGSVFRNPPGDSAGRLIEAAGLKGLRVGGAVVSDKHANFFQAEAGATARDVLDLVAEVRRRVAKASGVDLVPELHVVGDDEGVE